MSFIVPISKCWDSFKKLQDECDIENDYSTFIEWAELKYNIKVLTHDYYQWMYELLEFKSEEDYFLFLMRWI